MKQTVIFFLFLFFQNAYAQQWGELGINKHSKFKFEYWFKFDHKDDTTTYRFEKKAGNEKSTIRLRDNKGDTLAYFIFRVKNRVTDSVTNYMTNDSGVVQYTLRPGKYEAVFTMIGYDPFTFQFEISGKEQIEFNVQLGLGPEEEVYQINSKTRLTNEEISQIIQCAKVSGGDFYKNCSDKKRYNVIMQI